MKETSKSWKLWKEFCDSTNREFHWAVKCISLLNSYNLLPINTILDVGCGTGAFTSCFKSHCTNLIGVDNVDFRTMNEFEFLNIDFQNYDNIKPDLLIFKQSFHLIPNIWDVLEKYSNSTILILQMPKPTYFNNNEVWLQEPFNVHANADRFVSLGREVILKNEFLEIPLKTEFYEKMIKGGYSSDLRKLTKKKREEIWNSLNLTHDSIIFKDDLDILLVR